MIQNQTGNIYYLSNGSMLHIYIASGQDSPWGLLEGPLHTRGQGPGMGTPLHFGNRKSQDYEQGRKHKMHQLDVFRELIYHIKLVMYEGHTMKVCLTLTS
jgi:hypothetical protein